MVFQGILIANRGEIAIRIARAAAELGIKSVAIYSEDDASSLHTKIADESFLLPGLGAAAYLNMEEVINAAKKSGCDAIHPGYGFLSEQASFAEKCAEAGLTFIGPKVEHLKLFGDKGAARAAAISAGVPVLKGIDKAVTLEEASAFFDEVEGGIIIKAVAGGGGRGTRSVTDKVDLEDAFSRCESEAKASFGIGDLYVEEFVEKARHVEIQILGDADGNVVHFGERECSAQRRNQKVVEIAPAPGLEKELVNDMVESATQFATMEGYFSLGTFEFLVDVGSKEAKFVFIEANARLQVEHTVTEEVMGVDLVKSQIQIAMGSSISDLKLDDPSLREPSGFAIQSRVCLETIQKDGSILPSSGTLTAYEAPNGPGVRTDGFGYMGYQTSTAFDSLLAKVIVHSKSPSFGEAARKAERALSEFKIAGVKNNVSFLQNILSHEDFVDAKIHTRWIDEQAEILADQWTGPERFIAANADVEVGDGFAGARVDTSDPLALFNYDAEVKAAKPSSGSEPSAAVIAGPDGSVGVSSPIQGLSLIHI